MSPLGHTLHRILGRAVKPGSSKLLKRPNGARKPPPGRPGWASPRLGDAEDAQQSSATPGPPAPTLCAHSRAASRAPGSGLVKESSSEPVTGLLGRGALGGEPDPSDTGWGTSLGCPGRRHQGAPAAGPGAEAQPGKARSPSAETRQPRAVQTRRPDPWSVGRWECCRLIPGGHHPKSSKFKGKPTTAVIHSLKDLSMVTKGF